MNKLHFSTRIEAPRERVWHTMLDPETYRQWTAEFMEGSYFEGSWAAGEKIRFLGPGGSGMVAEVAESRPHEFVSLRHLGFVKDGVEDTTSEAVRAWAPAYENYTLREDGTGTELRVDQDVTPDFEEDMATAWPRALARLKVLCEG